MSTLAIFNAKLWYQTPCHTQHIIPSKTDANNKPLKLFHSIGTECGFGLYW